ncbi:MAG: hypothetical protein KGI78_04525 [Patescibacteria group bacterium]|nr:hypothetical protein [Patescibacteria group bacterium]MDE1944264.1 hypothetical protein [Patescibacteria group bacterium]MDE1945174.1 hypothetical protein [Patescibacteria group bacterium]MDE2058075.1 hypothetical protein [Patescibacteria group bacterium]
MHEVFNHRVDTAEIGISVRTGRSLAEKGAPTVHALVKLPNLDGLGLRDNQKKEVVHWLTGNRLKLGMTDAEIAAWPDTPLLTRRSDPDESDQGTAVLVTAFVNAFSIIPNLPDGYQHNLFASLMLVLDTALDSPALAAMSDQEAGRLFMAIVPHVQRGEFEFVKSVLRKILSWEESRK